MSAPAPARQPDRADWIHAALVAAALLALYAATSPRSVGPEDDGLFILSSYFLGIEHPPGYPLFTILGKLFTLLPFGSVAYRVHLLSALFGALTCAALWMCVRQLVEGRRICRRELRDHRVDRPPAVPGRGALREGADRGTPRSSGVCTSDRRGRAAAR